MDGAKQTTGEKNVVYDACQEKMGPLVVVSFALINSAPFCLQMVLHLTQRCAGVQSFSYSLMIKGYLHMFSTDKA